MGLIKPLIWWGYLDTDGAIHVKKYISDKALQNCEQMPFCYGIFDPFEAWDQADAVHKCKEKLIEMNFYQKKAN